ncbi:hypothetical protein MKX01_021441 [Papaver californicum]|nr:hypothetical protein MKX01_021441 [Papaver californicum]
MEYFRTRIEIFIFFMLVMITGSYWMRETEATGRHRVSPSLPTNHQLITTPSLVNQTNDEPKDCKKLTAKCKVCCKYTVCDIPIELLICIECCPPGTPAAARP